jgi:predicted TIM-barrel fold metal-dependent hydrolase
MTDSHIDHQKEDRHSSRNDNAGLLERPLPSADDPESSYVPDSLPCIVDAHVHLFPDNLFSSVWKWFGQHGWPIRYQLTSEEIINFLLSRGIDHIVALHYAHKPGVARELNAYMTRLCRSDQRVTGMATVFPGEEDAGLILEDAFQQGLSGVKLHCHVQCFDMNSESMQEIYEICTRHNKPLIMHVGREPKSPAYPCDPYELCSADKLEQVLKDYPDLKLCVPHLGADEFDAYRRLIEKYDRLWLDTTMTLADYLPMDYFPDLAQMRIERVMFGTDFPNLPYAWDREIKRLVGLKLSDDIIARILGENAVEFYRIKARPTGKQAGTNLA